MPRYKKNSFQVSPQDYDYAMELIARARQSFGYTLRRKRRALGLTLSELSSLCGISIGRLSEYENIKRFPTPPSKGKIINALRNAGLSNESKAELNVAYQDDKLRISNSSFAKFLLPEKRTKETVTQVIK